MLNLNTLGTSVNYQQQARSSPLQIYPPQASNILTQQSGMNPHIQSLLNPKNSETQKQYSPYYVVQTSSDEMVPQHRIAPPPQQYVPFHNKVDQRWTMQPRQGTEMKARPMDKEALFNVADVPNMRVEIPPQKTKVVPSTLLTSASGNIGIVQGTLTQNMVLPPDHRMKSLNQQIGQMENSRIQGYLRHIKAQSVLSKPSIPPLLSQTLMPNGIGLAVANTEEIKNYKLTQVERIQKLNELNKRQLYDHFHYVFESENRSPPTLQSPLANKDYLKTRMYVDPSSNGFYIQSAQQNSSTTPTQKYLSTNKLESFQNKFSPAVEKNISDMKMFPQVQKGQYLEKYKNSLPQGTSIENHGQEILIKIPKASAHHSRNSSGFVLPKGNSALPLVPIEQKSRLSEGGGSIYNPHLYSFQEVLNTHKSKDNETLRIKNIEANTRTDSFGSDFNVKQLLFQGSKRNSGFQLLNSSIGTPKLPDNSSEFDQHPSKPQPTTIVPPSQITQKSHFTKPLLLQKPPKPIKPIE
ncbi:hypothetical protein FGO68_gene10468 [Halteria grandinella]|uniref:Uncharacterized protein n=1 Tax=Halteria grandinella TaxID=5974 RepID=A0A8J8NZS9_HALGN|nr:hypothetical protein FGO68_gene10468 [Halteria grandinella]